MQASVPGLVGMTRTAPRRQFSPHAAPGEKLRYSCACPMQIGPDKAVLLAGLECVGGRSLDFAGGADAIVFDRLDDIAAAPVVPLLRNESITNPLNGEPCVMLKFPMTGGFVPCGARLPDGRPHPHAGTGFGITVAYSLPCRLLESGEALTGSWVHGRDVYRLFVLGQFAFDGRRFSVLRTDSFGFKELLPGWTLSNRGLGNAIPDGPDLLLPMQGGPGDMDVCQWMTHCGCGVMRWARGADGWRPVAFTPATQVTPEFHGTEPSLVRDRDGALLLSARQTGAEIKDKFDVYVWRSADGGAAWSLILHEPRVRAESPVSINAAADGTVFIAGNLLAGKLGSAETRGYTREILCLWPLNEQRDKLERPVFARCAGFEWGPPPADAWSVDHPMSAVLRLADGRAHTVLCYRGMCRAETGAAHAPTVHTGCYVDEILTLGPERAAPWNWV